MNSSIYERLFVQRCTNFLYSSPSLEARSKVRQNRMAWPIRPVSNPAHPMAVCTTAKHALTQVLEISTERIRQ
ncbi:hypothetical protein D3C78_738830 [compost metagenome]